MTRYIATAAFCVLVLVYALAQAYAPHYQMAPGPGGVGYYRLDERNGDVSFCAPSLSKPGVWTCQTKTDGRT